MFAKGMWSYVTLLMVIFACVHINVAKTIRQRRSSCVYNQHTNGCSTPTGYEPYREEFTPACNEHDVCYFCGKRYGITRYQCDVAFKEKMYEICDAMKRKRFLWNTVVHLATGNTCKVTADVYFGAVDNFGASHYEDPSPSWCEESCVTDLLGKYFVIA